MSFPDIYDNTVLTELIRRDWQSMAAQAQPGEDRTFFASRILPLREQRGRHVKIRVQDILPLGMAQFRAPHADPMLWTPRPTLREEVIEIVDIDEMHRIDPVTMLALKSRDPNVFDEAVLSITERGTGLQTRNELRTEWMRWEALKGALVIPFPNAGSVTVNYGIPAGHFVSLVGADQWTEANLASMDPIEDLWTLGAVATSTAGVYLSLFHMQSATFRMIRRADKVRGQLSSYGRNVMLPTDRDLQQLLREQTQIEVIDTGYLPEGATDHTLTRWLGANKVFATPSNYSYGGRPIGDMADGWVLVSIPGSEEPAARQGMQSEMLHHKFRKQTFLRQASARIPRLYAPEALAWMTVA